MARQNNVTLSRETKKQVLRAHMDYVRDRLETCVWFYKENRIEAYLLIVRNLYNANRYLESIGVFNLVKLHLLNDIIDNYLEQNLDAGRCTA